jgi:hypothetical protein
MYSADPYNPILSLYLTHLSSERPLFAATIMTFAADRTPLSYRTSLVDGETRFGEHGQGLH